MTTYLITGAARGIGLELTKRLIERGDEVWAGVRGPSAALDTLAGRSGGRLHLLTLEVSDETSVEQAKAVVGDTPIDVLINNAGVVGPERQSTTDMDFEGFERTLQVNTLAPLRVTQAFLPNIRASRAGKIVTVSSLMGSMRTGRSESIAYRASKAAVNKLMQGLATDLEAEGIAVASLHPGWVRTDMGGEGADIDVGESAHGLIGVIDRLALSGTGRFIDWRGNVLTW